MINNNTTAINDIFNRFNDLAVESTHTLIDSSINAQRQGISTLQNVLNATQESQSANREIANRVVRQAQTAQGLWFQFAQEAFRTNLDTFNRTSDQAVNNATETAEAVNKQVNKVVKPGDTAGK